MPTCTIIALASAFAFADVFNQINQLSHAERAALHARVQAVSKDLDKPLDKLHAQGR